MKVSDTFIEGSLFGIEDEMFAMRLGILEFGKAWIRGMTKITRARAFNAQMQSK